MRIVQYNKITEIKNPRVVKKKGRTMLPSKYAVSDSKKIQIY